MIKSVLYTHINLKIYGRVKQFIDKCIPGILNVKRHKYLQIYTTYINENHILNYAIFIHITKGYPQSYQTQ